MTENSMNQNIKSRKESKCRREYDKCAIFKSIQIAILINNVGTIRLHRKNKINPYYTKINSK